MRTHRRAWQVLGPLLFLPLLACEGQNARPDGGLDGYEEIAYWGACPFPYTRPREHLLVDEMGVTRAFLEQHVRCLLRHEALEAEILIKARPVRADMSRGAEYEAERVFVCRDGQVEELPVELCQFVWRHHNWKEIMIVLGERRYVFGFSEMCLGARPCTPWPDEFDVRLQADTSLIAEGLPCDCAAVGPGGVPAPLVPQVRIPPGPDGETYLTFTMGSTDGEPDEAPQVTFQVFPHRLDVREATWEDLAFFLNDQGNDCGEGPCAAVEAEGFRVHRVDGRWTADPGFEDRPAVHLTWHGAEAYCRWRRMLLPAEAVWEMAASAMGERRYPWGDEAPDCDRALHAACGAGEPEPVCARPAGHSREGVCNLADNVSEWVSNWYAADLYATCQQDSTCFNGPWSPREERSVRGGSFAAPALALRATDRASAPPESHAPDRGVRCMSGNPSF
jgi:formylglycine-generating enzyme required for sulfatase activity